MLKRKAKGKSSGSSSARGDGDDGAQAASSSTLPPGWRAFNDKASGRTYFAGPGGQTQWEPPTAQGTGDAEPGAREQLVATRASFRPSTSTQQLV